VYLCAFERVLNVFVLCCVCVFESLCTCMCLCVPGCLCVLGVCFRSATCVAVSGVSV
jgi:hypothetical protein